MKYGNTVKKFIVFSLIIAVGTVLVLAGQVGQYTASLKDARMHTISLLNKQNPNRKHISKQFIDECLTSKMIDNAELHKQISGESMPISIYECGHNLGAQDLVIAIRKTDHSMSSLAWPLSVMFAL